MTNGQANGARSGGERNPFPGIFIGTAKLSHSGLGKGNEGRALARQTLAAFAGRAAVSLCSERQAGQTYTTGAKGLQPGTEMHLQNVQQAPMQQAPPTAMAREALAESCVHVEFAA